MLYYLTKNTLLFDNVAFLSSYTTLAREILDNGLKLQHFPQLPTAFDKIHNNHNKG